MSFQFIKCCIFFIVLSIPWSLAVASEQNNIDKANDIIKKQIQHEIQREKFDTKQKQAPKQKDIYETEQIVVNGDRDELECIEIDTINIRGSTIFDEEEFEELKKPYLKNCNGMDNLTNLLNKITNMYIDKGYVTSRAYLKQQDLSDGTVDIDILESRIERIEFINTSPLIFMNIYEDQILNLRDLEVELQQRNRLRSLDYNINLKPGTKPGYSVVGIVAVLRGNPYYGSVGVNNFGSQNTGKYQFSLNGNYENLFNISDILSLNINSTDKVFQSHNYSNGSSVQYSFPYGRVLFDFNYLLSQFDIAAKDEFSHDIITSGSSNTMDFGAKYKLYHNLEHALELIGRFHRVQSKNALTVYIEDDNGNLFPNTTSLAQQSYTLASMIFGVNYSYQTDMFNTYVNANVIQGLGGQSSIDTQVPQNKDFTKFELQMNMSKRFSSEYEPTFNCSFIGQYVDKYVFAVDEISIGGPYSVRGFGESGISGEQGFYVRNDLSFASYKENIRFSPYMGLDYGYIAAFKSTTKEADILGSAVGIKSSYKGAVLDLFYHHPLKDAAVIKKQNVGFFGFSLNYYL